MGLVAAVGGACTIGCDTRLLASAQQDFEHVISDDGDTMVRGAGGTRVNGNGFTRVAGNGITLVSGNGITLVSGRGETHVGGTGFTVVERTDPTVVAGNGGTLVIGNGQLTVPGNAAIVAEGANRINAGDRSTVYSSSSNLFTHDGTGAGIIDGGDIEFSGFADAGFTRNVTVQNANSLTVAPGIPTRIQNGTTFTIGCTAQETLENLQRAMELVPDNGQQMAPSIYLSDSFPVSCRYLRIFYLVVGSAALAAASKTFLKNYNTQALD